MDSKEVVVSVAPLVCAALIVCAGLAAYCIRPAEAAAITDLVKDALVLCAGAWQAARSLPKQPGA